MRRLIERLSRGKSFKRKLPAEFGRTPLYVSPDSQLKYLKLGTDAFDADLLAVVREHVREESVVWDIGANIGVLTFAAASIARRGSVLAVEADAWLAGLIRRSVMLQENRGLRVQVLSCAIADTNGVGTLLIAGRGRASNALISVGGRSQMGGVREKVIVPTLTLDTLLDAFDPPTFVKIDVEGAEAIALRGAGRLLAATRPTFYVEVGPDADVEVSSLFHRNDYFLFDGSKPLQSQAPAASCAFNTLAVPKERFGALRTATTVVR